MAIQLDNVLSGAALNDTERRVVERIVAWLRDALGDDLLAVWLYGSRARGEADPTETDFDRRSDIDLMAIVDSRRDAGAFKWDFTPKLIEAVEAEGDSPPFYSCQRPSVSPQRRPSNLPTDGHVPSPPVATVSPRLSPSVAAA